MVIRKLYVPPTAHHRVVSKLTEEISHLVPVVVAQGKVLGVKEVLPNGKDCFTFKGIPYAKPPVGELRFKPPVELEKFSEPVLKCTKEGNVSVQKDDFITKVTIGSEDSLFLNVFTPKLPKEDEKENVQLLPVMIFIHGGGFKMGSGDCDFYNPELLIQEGVVCVTFNYRLGPLGFLCLPGAGIDGNMGLKDQLMVFKWVQKNISKFCGDPNNVTIFGESAGGASVHYHYISPNSRDYFHKAICQSGTSLSQWAIAVDREDASRKLAKVFGYEGYDVKEALETLMKADAKELSDRQDETMSDYEKTLDLFFPFKPVVENENIPDAILPLHPLELLRDSDLSGKPLIMGINNKEGLFTFHEGFDKIELYEKEPERLVPDSVDVDHDFDFPKLLGEDIKKQFFDDKTINCDTADILVDVISDIHFNNPAFLATEIQSQRQQEAQQFFYIFSFDGELNGLKKMLNLTAFKGAGHGDELSYIFTGMLSKMAEKIGPKEVKVRDNIVKMWTNFAKFSNPTPNEELSFKWVPVEASSNNFKLDYLSIDENCEMQQNPNKERVDFWKSIYEKYNDGFLNPKISLK